MTDYKTPFPWFGGKRMIAPAVWARFGSVQNYVEPFFGSGAMLIQAPWPADRIETVNDKDGMVSNFWRALQHDPEQVAHFADWPVNENDLHARHSWLVGQKDSLQVRLEGDTEFFNAKVAGWWVWGICCWIGSGFCSGQGPWHVVDGELVNGGSQGMGVNRQRVHLGSQGMGVNRQRVHLGDPGRGDPGTGECGLVAWMQALADRLRRVRVCCGDWSRVCGDSPTIKHGLTAMFLDQPYSEDAGREAVYSHESFSVAKDAMAWAIEHGDDPIMRIAFCGYAGEHEFPGTWDAWAWKAHGGYGLQGDGRGRSNRHQETVWFSPHCLKVRKEEQDGLFP